MAPPCPTSLGRSKPISVFQVVSRRPALFQAFNKLDGVAMTAIATMVGHRFASRFTGRLRNLLHAIPPQNLFVPNNAEAAEVELEVLGGAATHAGKPCNVSLVCIHGATTAISWISFARKGSTLMPCP